MGGVNELHRAAPGSPVPVVRNVPPINSGCLIPARDPRSGTRCLLACCIPVMQGSPKGITARTGSSAPGTSLGSRAGSKLCPHLADKSVRLPPVPIARGFSRFGSLSWSFPCVELFQQHHGAPQIPGGKRPRVHRLLVPTDIPSWHTSFPSECFTPSARAPWQLLGEVCRLAHLPWLWPRSVLQGCPLDKL